MHLDGAHGSQHQYGCAADLQTFPVRLLDEDGNRFFETPEDSTGAQRFWDDLADLAEENYELWVEPIDDSGIGHVHMDNC